MAGRVDPDDVRREFTAQLEAVAQLGLPITHLDAHQHLHLWPSMCKLVLDLAVEFGIEAVRVPRSRPTNVTGAGVTLLARRLARRAEAAGLRYPADSVGIDGAGQLDAGRLPVVLARLAARGRTGVELTVHPGENDDPDRVRYRWGYRWPSELDALVGPEALGAVARTGFTLGTYADLAAVSTGLA